MADINKKTLEYLADLGKMWLDGKDEDKLLRDLQKILRYFEELEEVNTQNVEPLSGGTTDHNIFREDDAGGPKLKARKEKLIAAFPKEEKGFLKVPAVFE